MNSHESETPSEGSPNLEPALQEALGDEPRADELTQMIAVLLQRFEGIREEYQAETDEATKSRQRRELERLRNQILVLREEAQISQFVEDTVRVGVEMREMENY